MWPEKTLSSLVPLNGWFFIHFVFYEQIKYSPLSAAPPPRFSGPRALAKKYEIETTEYKDVNLLCFIIFLCKSSKMMHASCSAVCLGADWTESGFTGGNTLCFSLVGDLQWLFMLTSNALLWSRLTFTFLIISTYFIGKQKTQNKMSGRLTKVARVIRICLV